MATAPTNEINTNISRGLPNLAGEHELALDHLVPYVALPIPLAEVSHKADNDNSEQEAKRMVATQANDKIEVADSGELQLELGLASQDKSRLRKEARGRCLHLVDIENLTGSPSPSHELVVDVRDRYNERFVQEGDHVIIAGSHHAMRTVAFAWPDARLLQRSGRDGADRALIETLRDERLAENFNTVIIGSGDGIFAEVCTWLAKSSVMTVAVSNSRSIAIDLRLAADKTIYLDMEALQVSCQPRRSPARRRTHSRRIPSTVSQLSV